MISFPVSKINLGLSIIGKRTDGFHDLESVFYPIPFCDVLEILPSPDGVSRAINYTGKMFSETEISNHSCLKAHEILVREFGIPPVEIRLLKNIPFGSGMGGGSSNAVEALKLMAGLFNLEVNREKLLSWAAEIGSDCPFFVDATPARVTGRGDVIEPVKLSLKGYHLLLVFPGVEVSTPWAFSKIKPGGRNEEMVPVILSGNLKSWQGIVRNDFEAVVFEKYPRLKLLKEALYSMGAVYASMSGSGATLYGIFENRTSAGVLGSEVQCRWVEL
jgi:4-diphosphocytidyl-2-C-methyl-D-erythritol kinase